MPRRLLVLAVALLAVAAALLPAAARPARTDNPVLTGTVGTNDAFQISLVDAMGNRVTHLDPGTYTLLVHDRSALHDFHLFGPGVDVTTDVEFVGDKTFTITLQDGKYVFHCDPHLTLMHGRFTVGAVPPPPPAPIKLAASVGPGARIALRSANGLRTSAVPVGPATITVRDLTKKDNFHLVGPGVNKATGVAFTGRMTWHVTLGSGRYVYRSDRHNSLHGSFTAG